MDQKVLFKQMIDFHKATFDNSFNAMTTLQEQGEKMVGIFLDQAAWLPEEGKKIIREWTDTYKKGRIEFRKNVETQFEKVENYFGGVS
ncbi:MAG: hypothetical protein HC887_04125 [Desulfobacteraceae bacterium]|nr:hypothetical protein [Desulfobacteraceae bacterium]